MLRVKNKTKNNIITRLREINHASEIEKQALRAEVKTLHAEGVMNNVMMGAKIRELENKVRYYQEEASIQHSSNNIYSQARNREVSGDSFLLPAQIPDA
jgi:predicted transcriptional regulator